MSETSKKANAESRKLEKRDRKQENVAKVEATKKQTMWEKLSADKSGVKTVIGDDGEKTQSKVARTRKVQTKNLISHRRTRQRAKPVCVQLCNSTKIVRVSHTEARVLVSKGGKYITKSAWREQKSTP